MPDGDINPRDLFIDAVRGLYGEATGYLQSKSDVPLVTRVKWNRVGGNEVQRQTVEVPLIGGLSERRRGELTRLPTWKAVRRLVGRIPVVARMFNAPVAVLGGHGSLNLDHVWWNLLGELYIRAGGLAFDNAMFDLMRPEITSFFFADGVAVRLVAPLQNADLDDTLKLDGLARIDRLAPEHAAPIEEHYLRDLGNDRYEPPSKWAVFAEAVVPKRFGDDVRNEEWPSFIQMSQEYVEAIRRAIDAAAEGRVICPSFRIGYRTWSPMGGTTTQTNRSMETPPGPARILGGSFHEAWGAAHKEVVENRPAKPGPRPHRRILTGCTWPCTAPTSRWTGQWRMPTARWRSACTLVRSPSRSLCRE